MRFGTGDGKQQMVPLGNDPYVALDKLAAQERYLRDRARGLETTPPMTVIQPQNSRLKVDAAIEQYFKNLQLQGKDPKTIPAYRVAIDEFRESCSKEFLDEVGKQDLLDFMGWLRNQPPKLRKNGTPRKGENLATRSTARRNNHSGLRTIGNILRTCFPRHRLSVRRLKKWISSLGRWVGHS